jgi:hypothetical protein
MIKFNHQEADKNQNKKDKNFLLKKEKRKLRVQKVVLKKEYKMHIKCAKFIQNKNRSFA